MSTHRLANTSSRIMPSSQSREDYAMCHPANEDCCCLCYGPFQNAVYFASYVMIFLSILIPLVGIVGLSIVSLSNGMDKLMSVDSDTKDALKDLEQEAWLVYGLVGLIAAILTSVPIYGARHQHSGMVAFGIVLLLGTAIVQYLLGALYYIPEANRMICASGDQACSQNTFRQPIGVYCLSSFVLGVFVYAHIRLIWDIRASRRGTSSETNNSLETIDAASQSVNSNEKATASTHDENEAC